MCLSVFFYRFPSLTSLSLSLFLSFSLSLSLSLALSFSPLSIRFCLCLFHYRSIYLLIFISQYLSVGLSVNIYQSIRYFVCLSVDIYLSVNIYLSVYPSIYLSLFMYLSTAVYSFLSTSFITYLSIYLSIYLSKPCRIRRLHPWRGQNSPPPLMSVLDMSKPADNDAAVQTLWGIWNTPSLLLLPAPRWPRVLVPVRVPSMDQIIYYNWNHLIVCH